MHTPVSVVSQSRSEPRLRHSPPFCPLRSGRQGPDLLKFTRVQECVSLGWCESVRRPDLKLRLRPDLKLRLRRQRQSDLLVCARVRVRVSGRGHTITDLHKLAPLCDLRLSPSPLAVLCVGMNPTWSTSGHLGGWAP